MSWIKSLLQLMWGALPNPSLLIVFYLFLGRWFLLSYLTHFSLCKSSETATASSQALLVSSDISNQYTSISNGMSNSLPNGWHSDSHHTQYSYLLSHLTFMENLLWKILHREGFFTTFSDSNILCFYSQQSNTLLKFRLLWDCSPLIGILLNQHLLPYLHLCTLVI